MSNLTADEIKHVRKNRISLEAIWRLKDIVVERPWVLRNEQDGSLVSVKIHNDDSINIVYKRYFDGKNELKYVEIKSTDVVQQSDGVIEYYPNNDTLYDDEAWAKVNCL